MPDPKEPDKAKRRRREAGKPPDFKAFYSAPKIAGIGKMYTDPKFAGIGKMYADPKFAGIGKMYADPKFLGVTGAQFGIPKIRDIFAGMPTMTVSMPNFNASLAALPKAVDIDHMLGGLTRSDINGILAELPKVFDAEAFNALPKNDYLTDVFAQMTPPDISAFAGLDFTASDVVELVNAAVEDAPGVADAAADFEATINDGQAGWMEWLNGLPPLMRPRVFAALVAFVVPLTLYMAATHGVDVSHNTELLLGVIVSSIVLFCELAERS